MTKLNLFVSTIALLGLNATACGSGGGDGNTHTATNTTILCSVSGGAGESCGSTQIATSTVTGTETQTSTITTVTKTETNTSTSTSTVPNPVTCDYTQPHNITGGKAIANTGLWTVVDNGVSWNICITYADPNDITVGGYAFKTGEINPSLVAYTGVMGDKCVEIYAVTASSGAPTLLATGVTANVAAGTVTINDPEHTATWSNDTTGCPYKIPGT